VVVELLSSESLRSHFYPLPILAHRKSLSSVVIIAHSYIVSFNEEVLTLSSQSLHVNQLVSSLNLFHGRPLQDLASNRLLLLL
jgi:hypothetical protein